MAPQEKTETSPLFEPTHHILQQHHHQQQDLEGSSSRGDSSRYSGGIRKEFEKEKQKNPWRYVTISVCALVVLSVMWMTSQIGKQEAILEKTLLPQGPYQLVELQEGNSFLDSYDFYDGPDSLGSAGFNTYVSLARAEQLGIFNVTTVVKGEGNDDAGQSPTKKKKEYVYMSSASTKEGPRESIRLEGKHRYNHGLFILDLEHMPAGCGFWPAFWLTNERDWPQNGEIDIVEGINYQSVAKTAMHTSDRCNMFAHVADYDRTGTWDWATGIPDTFTGKMDFNTSKPADDCWNLAPHQWANQGCVTVSPEEGTLGVPFNDNGGGIFALEWDPVYSRIRSWVFTPRDNVPPNLRDAIQTAHIDDETQRIVPDTDTWGLPYAYFAVGVGTGCSADHFRNMRIVLNLAFCGTVAGNRFFRDCPKQAKLFHTGGDPIQSCNDWIQSNPEELQEAYWKIGGSYVYQRQRS